MSTITIFNGPARVEMDLNGLTEATVANILDRLLADGANVPDGATPLVNGSEASSDTTVAEGDEVSFAKPTGEKGLVVILR